MEYAKDHTISEIWMEHPTSMLKFHRGMTAFKTAIVSKQKQRPKLSVVYGKTGTGKSHTIRMKASNSPSGIEEGDRDYYVVLPPRKDGFVWLERYFGQKHAIIEDFSGEIDYRTLLRMTDKWSSLMEYKGSSVQWSPSHIYISSNIHPKYWYPTQEPADTWGTGPLSRRLKGAITHKVIPYAE